MRNSGKLNTFLGIFAGVNECSSVQNSCLSRLELAILWLKVAKNYGVAKIRVFLGRIFGISLAQGGKETWRFQNFVSFCMLEAQKRLRFRQSVDNARQNCPKYVYFSRKFRTFPVTEGTKFSILFPVHNPGKKAHPQHKFEGFWMQKDTNFGNAMNLWHFGPEKRQKPHPERHEFWKRHNSLLPWPENCQIQP